MGSRTVTTDGIILRKSGIGEANALFIILTKKLGMVYATARSCRLVKSKLRYGLEPMTRARFSLVRGRNEWKIIGVYDHTRLDGDFLCAGKDVVEAMRRILYLLLRFVHGEEHAPEPFLCVVRGLEFIAKLNDSEKIKCIESIIALKILDNLGYVAYDESVAEILSTDISDETANISSGVQMHICLLINSSIIESGL